MRLFSTLGAVLMRFSDKLVGMIIFLTLYGAAGYLVWLALAKWYALLRVLFH